MSLTKNQNAYVICQIMLHCQYSIYISLTDIKIKSHIVFSILLVWNIT